MAVLECTLDNGSKISVSVPDITSVKIDGKTLPEYKYEHFRKSICEDDPNEDDLK